MPPSCGMMTLLVLGGSFIHSASAAELLQAPVKLRVEYLKDPITIDSHRPRFSWALTGNSERGVSQYAWNIRVVQFLDTDSQQLLMWDSGLVVSNRTLNVEYGSYGNFSKLESDVDYVWYVRWWSTSVSDASPWTQGNFSTAILADPELVGSSADWHNAVWVSSTNNGSLDTYRTEFNIPSKPIRARLYVSGLGYAKTWLNGNLTDDHELGEFTTFQERVLYDCIDVLSLVKEGRNALGIMLGNGWFASANILAGPRQFMLLLSVTSANATRTFYASTTSTQTHSKANVLPLYFNATRGPVTFQAAGPGERYDGRIIKQLAGWNQIDYSPSPTAVWEKALTPVTGPTVFGSIITSHKVVINTDTDYIPISVTEPDPSGHPGVYVVDFGQNMAGQVTLRLKNCPIGHNVSMQHTEILYPNGLAHNSFCERPKYWLCNTVQFANYTCSGADSETYRVTFTYMGFRYVQVLGYPGDAPTQNDLTAHFVHSDIGKTGMFTSSSSLLNKIQHATRFAAMSNAMDIPTDCPQREKQGWLGDAQLAFDTVVHNFDTGAFYTKWIHDLGDVQMYNNETLASDMGFPECAPFYGHGNLEADPGWGIAAWNVPLGFASYFDDTRIEEAWYPHARAYMEHWIKLAQNNSGILQLTKEGDWGNYDNNNGNPMYTFSSYSQYFYISALDSQSSFAKSMGYSEDHTRYSELASKARQAYLNAFYNETSGCFGNCSDIEQIFGISAKVLPAHSQSEKQAWVHALSWFGATGKNPTRFGGGIIGIKLLYSMIDYFGMSDLGLQLQLHRDQPPSFGYWIEQNATTLWEFWGNSATTFNSGLNSYNHIMYGGSGNWYYSTLAGIQRKADSRSWSQLVFAPPSGGILNLLDWAKASIDTPMGLVSTSWEYSKGPKILAPVYVLNITVPPNGVAQVVFPTIVSATTVEVQESGKSVWSRGKYIPGVPGFLNASIVPSGDAVAFEVGSGSFYFASHRVQEAV